MQDSELPARRCEILKQESAQSTFRCRRPRSKKSIRKHSRNQRWKIRPDNTSTSWPDKSIEHVRTRAHIFILVCQLSVKRRWVKPTLKDPKAELSTRKVLMNELHKPSSNLRTRFIKTPNRVSRSPSVAPHDVSSQPRTF